MPRWLSFLGLDTGGFDRWEMHFAGLERPLAYVIIGALAIVSAIWIRSSAQGLADRKRRIVVIALQVIAAALIALAVAQPAIRLTKVARVREKVVVLFDTSSSMNLPGAKSGENRIEEAKRYVEKHDDFFRGLADEFSVVYYGFDREARDASGMDRWEKADGDATDIMAALGRAGEQSGGMPLAGVVMFSDGTDTRRLAAMEGETTEPDLSHVLADFPAPVNTVSLGVGARVSDISIVEASHDDYGFVHNPFQVRVRVRRQGKVPDTSGVIFKQGEKVLSSQELNFSPGEETAEAVLSFTPRQVGEFLFSVEVPPVEGEITTANNLVRFPLKVLRDKVRVLYLCGNPSWDERFLRELMKKNPAVDLISFYILREFQDSTRAAEHEVSLIPFPTDKLFMEELDTFDMVIWQNFRGSQYMAGFYSTYMEKLRDFVEKRGGALLMLGGHRGFFGQGRMDPNLLELLPVRPMDDVPNYIEGEFKPVLTEAGLAHPIMDVGDAGEATDEIWHNLPPIFGFNRTAGLAPGSLMLLAHPEMKGDDGAMPIAAIKEAGAGRVMAVMTDYTWQWRFAAVLGGGSGKPYERFWENSLRWLMQDPRMKLISLTADKGRVLPGEPVSVVAEVLDETYRPNDDAQLKIDLVESPAGDTISIPEPEHIGLGKYKLTIIPPRPGAYRLRATATLNGRSLGSDDEIFAAQAESEEWRDILPHPGLLASISTATHGAAISTSDGPDNMIFNRRKIEEVTGTRDYPLWDNWPAFIVIISVLILGWFFRRKWGLR